MQNHGRCTLISGKRKFTITAKKARQKFMQALLHLPKIDWALVACSVSCVPLRGRDEAIHDPLAGMQG
jgi:hypothetical protein